MLALDGRKWLSAVEMAAVKMGGLLEPSCPISSLPIQQYIYGHKAPSQPPNFLLTFVFLNSVTPKHVAGRLRIDPTTKTTTHTTNTKLPPPPRNCKHSLLNICTGTCTHIMPSAMHMQAWHAQRHGKGHPVTHLSAHPPIAGHI